MNYVLFSIDNVTDTHTLAKFLRHFDTQVAMGKTKGYLIQCIGSYEGNIELSFICNKKDYVDYVVPFGVVRGQDCVIEIKGEDCYLSDNDLIFASYMGVIKQVTKKKAMKSDGWTYRPDLNSYFVIKEQDNETGNN